MLAPLRWEFLNNLDRVESFILLIEKPFHGLVTPESFQGLNLAHFLDRLSVSLQGVSVWCMWVIKISTYLFTHVWFYTFTTTAFIHKKSFCINTFILTALPSTFYIVLVNNAVIAT